MKRLLQTERVFRFSSLMPLLGEAREQFLFHFVHTPHAALSFSFARIRQSENEDIVDYLSWLFKMII